MQDLGARSKLYFKPNGEAKLAQNSRGKVRRPSTRQLSDIIQSTDEKFLDFLSECFAWHPKDRITPSQALLHPWILEGLPGNVRQQHCRLFGKDGAQLGPKVIPSDPLLMRIEEMTNKPIQGFPKDKKDLEIGELIEEIDVE